MKKLFGKLSNGEDVYSYTIENGCGESVTLLDFGAAIHEINVLDKYGQIANVSLQVKDAVQLEGHNKEGVTVGRCANRIGRGHFVIDGEEVNLTCNMPGSCLHSGSGNYARKHFNAEQLSANSIRMTIEDKEFGGFPGNVLAEVTFSLSDDHVLSIDYDLVSDKATVLSPTNHTYFDLSAGNGIDGQLLKVDCDFIAVKDEYGVPWGELGAVEGTKFDFRNEAPVSAGYDDYFILNRKEQIAASVRELKSGRHMDVVTDMPCLVIFTPLDKEKNRGAAICLEAQYVPNAVNVPSFDSPVFAAGEHMRAHTEYRFSVDLD